MRSSMEASTEAEKKYGSSLLDGAIRAAIGAGGTRHVVAAVAAAVAGVLVGRVGGGTLGGRLQAVAAEMEVRDIIGTIAGKSFAYAQDAKEELKTIDPGLAQEYQHVVAARNSAMHPGTKRAGRNRKRSGPKVSAAESAMAAAEAKTTTKGAEDGEKANAQANDEHKQQEEASFSWQGGPGGATWADVPGLGAELLASLATAQPFRLAGESESPTQGLPTAAGARDPVYVQTAADWHSLDSEEQQRRRDNAKIIRAMKKDEEKQWKQEAKARKGL